MNPRLGETVLDPAAGTGGFLAEAYEHLKSQVKSVENRRQMQEETLFGIEKKPMPYLLGMMNLLLHGVDRPNLARDNALGNPLVQITDSARYNVIMTNPPFGGEEEKGIQENFPESTRTSETALLFLQFIMRSLKRGGRCGMVVPNGVLFGDGVCARIKKDLLENFNLHTIVRLPNGVFAPYTSIPTNPLFFDKTGPTKEIWYYDTRCPKAENNTRKPTPSSARSSPRVNPGGPTAKRTSTPGKSAPRTRSSRMRPAIICQSILISRIHGASNRWITCHRSIWWATS